MSPVLAQAALTRNFDVQDEIEVRDDLDKKPDDTETEISLAKEFPALFIQLLSEIKNEVETGKYSLPVQSDFVVDARYDWSVPCSSKSIGLSFTDSDLFAFASKSFDEKFDSKISKILNAEDGKSKSGNVRIETNDTDFSLKVSFTKSNSAPFAALLNREFSLSALVAKNLLGKQLYENTKAVSENNQIFIVTRLPRGSLDALVKQGAKADNQ